MFKAACLGLLIGSQSAVFVPDVSRPQAMVSEVRYRSRAPAPEPTPQPLKGDPVFKCDGGKTPNQIHVDFSTTQDMRVFGGIDLMVKGENVAIPLEAKYQMIGDKLVVYGTKYGPASSSKSRRELATSRAQKMTIFVLDWEGDDQWTATVAGSKQKLKCTDFTKDDPKK